MSNSVPSPGYALASWSCAQVRCRQAAATPSLRRTHVNLLYSELLKRFKR
ncbi:MULTISPECIES: hypothetical protein [Planktothrix]|nr:MULTISPECIES: hypothetical protein [Planktothrix]